MIVPTNKLIHLLIIDVYYFQRQVLVCSLLRYAGRS